ncbi:MAG: hypothetical protein IPJ30_01000 [Acidobacteria bacterium]|nr:hypothetical protein [Acidobacteriota bacterium]
MRFKLPEIPPPKLITSLRNYNLLPAIIFLPTRRKCDEAATEVAGDRSQRTDPEKEAKRQKLFDEYVAQFPEIKSHKHRKILLRGGVAAHHAGHIPAWKLLVEKMMSGGLLNAIFATSTVAAGVDFPARTVVVTNADTRGNDGWRSLQASELQQMTGRAGRRGKDNVGFVVLAPGQFQNPPKLAQLLKSPPDALTSRFRATYSSLLNLLDAFKSFSQVREIAEKSFAFRETSHQISQLERSVSTTAGKIEKALGGSGFGLTVDSVRGFERLTSARLRLQEKLPQTRAEVRQNWLRDNVGAGRIVTRGRNSRKFFLVLNVFGDKVVAMRDDGQGATLALSQIGRVFETTYPLEERSLDKALDEIYRGTNTPLEEPRIAAINVDSDLPVEVIADAIDRLLAAGLSEDQKREANQLLWELWNDAGLIESTERDIETLRGEIWQPFERRARVLDHFGYLDFPAELVTERGKWLADLRVDRPLLVGEAISRGIFDGLDIKTTAALMASLAADSDRNYGEIYLSNRVLDLLTEFEEIVFNVSNVEWKFGVEPAPDLNFSAAAAAECWAGGMNWDELVFRSKAEEGDLVRLLSRTGEALRQIAQLKESNPAAAELAKQTAEMMLREPIR